MYFVGRLNRTAYSTLRYNTSWKLNKVKGKVIHNWAKPCNALKKEKNVYERGCSLFFRLSVCGVSTAYVTIIAKCEGIKDPITYRPMYEIEQDNIKQFDWATLWELLRPYWISLLAAIVAALTVAALNIQMPLRIGEIVNVICQFSMVSNSNNTFFQQIKWPLTKLLSIYVAQSVFTFAYVFLLSGIGEELAAQMKYKMFKSVMQQHLEFFDRNRTGEIINRLTTDVQEFKSTFKICISQGLRSIAQIAGCVTSLILISPEMTLVMVITLPAVIGVGTFFGSMLRKLSKQAQAQNARATIIGEEALSNIRTVRSFAMEQEECELFYKEIQLASKLQGMLGFGIALFQAGTNLFLNSIVVSTLCMGGHLLSCNRLTAGDLMSFLVSVQTIQKSLAQLSLLFGSFIKGIASGASVFQYINMEPVVPFDDKGITVPYHSFIADVLFENVSFSYPTRPQQEILKNFNLNIPAGKIAAIVGSSGNGKSTVAGLLMRFYDVTQGCVKVNDIDVRNMNEKWLRGQVIGLINQEPVLFATSIKENIRYGRPSATDAEVFEAAKLANADSFINQFPEGYETLVGEKGVAISGGQKQRIAIARALIKKPTILILDEATSALDSVSEKQVQESLERAMGGRTVLIIAHRLSTVRNADVVIVLKDGNIVEMGNHDSLMKKKSHYYQLMNQQKESKEE